MTTLDELRQAIEGVIARVALLEGHAAAQGAQMVAAGQKYLEMTAEVSYLKGQVNKGTGKNKEILESKAVQNLSKLTGPKEYRYWNQRFKNALDQARPDHGRKLIGYLETITENMVNNQKELSTGTDTTSWIRELIGEKEDDAGTTRTPRRS